jgi:Holliday junction resolvase-like predicted endonuclease
MASDAMQLEILKSSRHSKITGDFGEALVLYWLSKHGFECARVDHTGIDLIARNPNTRELMGISVKSRSRAAGTERTSVNIPNGDFAKAASACEAFACAPYFAIVVDAGDVVRAYLLAIDHLLGLHPRGKNVTQWSMAPKAVAAYAADPAIKCFEFQARTTRWW